MKNILVGLVAILCLFCSRWPALGQTTDPTPTASTSLEADAQSAGGKRAREFQGDDLGQVLRLLARQARINLMIDEAIKGNVNVRLENASAMDTIEAIVHLYKLVLEKDDKGVYYLRPPDPAAAAYDLLAKPVTAFRIAAYKHNLYTALIKEGFTPDEALKIVVASDASPQK